MESALGRTDHNALFEVPLQTRTEQHHWQRGSHDDAVLQHIGSVLPLQYRAPPPACFIANTPAICPQENRSKLQFILVTRVAMCILTYSICFINSFL